MSTLTSNYFCPGRLWGAPSGVNYFLPEVECRFFFSRSMVAILIIPEFHPPYPPPPPCFPDVCRLSSNISRSLAFAIPIIFCPSSFPNTHECAPGVIFIVPHLKPSPPPHPVIIHIWDSLGPLCYASGPCYYFCTPKIFLVPPRPRCCYSGDM
jgi:hypothetical protein